MINTRSIKDPIVAAPLLVAASCGVVIAVDPATGVYPPCPSQLLFGIDCPACGGLRATSALLQGDFSSFLDHNILLALAFPLLFAIWIVAIIGRLKPDRRYLLSTPVKRLLAVALVLILAVFTVTRNLVPYLGSGIG